MEKKFNSTDVNHDGYINYDEFSQMMLDLFHGKMADEEIQRLFKLMDKDKNQKITLAGIILASFFIK